LRAVVVDRDAHRAVSVVAIRGDPPGPATGVAAVVCGWFATSISICRRSDVKTLPLGTFCIFWCTKSRTSVESTLRPFAFSRAMNAVVWLNSEPKYFFSKAARVTGLVAYASPISSLMIFSGFSSSLSCDCMRAAKNFCARTASWAVKPPGYCPSSSSAALNCCGVIFA
jgi:hypothetical protein